MWESATEIPRSVYFSDGHEICLEICCMFVLKIGMER